MFPLRRFILPILAEYSDAGYREPKDRLLYSLRSNAQYYAIVISVGVIGLVYFISSYGFEFESFKGVIMALSYCWGLILAIYLMGHGLVSIPRTLIRNSSISGRLRRLQAHAPKLYEKMEDALLNLEELEVQVSELSKRKLGSARDHLDWIEELAEMCNIPESRPRTGAPIAHRESRVVPTVITEKYLADLTRQVDRAKHAKSRYVDDWNRLLREAAETQAILNSAGSKRLDFGTTSTASSWLRRTRILTPHSRFMVHYHFLPYARLTAGFLLGLASACIIWSELIKSVFPSLSIIRLTVVHHLTEEGGRVNFGGQLSAALWILYMCFAALASVTEVKVWRGRALVYRNTAHESAFWYASQVAKLSVPLSYNFVTFLSKAIYEKTQFYRFLGQYVDLTPLGKWFDYLFPILVIFPVVATIFGLYGKIRRMLGFGFNVIDDAEEENPTGYGTGSWREGRDLIERELNGTSISRRLDQAASRGGVRGRPILSVPPPRSQGTTTPFATSPTYRDDPSGSTAGASSRASAPPEGDDDNFFTNLGHRFKNTMDTIDTPKWFQEIGDGIKKPKWLGGDDDDRAGPSSRPSGANRNGSDLRSWFGGDGRVRL